MTHMWKLIFLNGTNELINEAETDLQTSKTNRWLPKGRNKAEIWD